MGRNIFEALREYHKIQRNLIEKLVNTFGDNDLRKNMFDKLKYELAIHADAEERHFYIPLIKKALSDQDKKSLATSYKNTITQKR